MKLCKICQNEIPNTKTYCSLICKRKNYAQITKVWKINNNKICKCGKKIGFYSKSCILCHNIERKEKAENRLNTITIKKFQKLLKKEHPSWKNPQIREYARRNNLELKLLPCASCGYSKHVEIAHIKSISSFHEDTLLSVVNAKTNLIQLCRNCHWEFDNNFLTLEQIKNKNLEGM